MTKRKMFLRMITASLLRRRSRMLIALLSIAVGATILSGLVTIYIDVPRQMGAQFRSYGANMILLPKEDGSLTMDSFQEAMGSFSGEEIVGATPYRYVRLDMPSRQQSFITAGCDFSEVQKTSPYFSVEGNWPENSREVLVGKEIAETIGVKEGSSIELSYKTTGSGDGDSASDRKAGAHLTGSAEGFNKVIVTAGLDLDEEGKIDSIEVDASAQTPGIGSLVGTDKAFLDQFIGKTLPLTLRSAGSGEDTGGDEKNVIDAVSGATISSRAVVDALNSAASPEHASVVENTEHFTVTGILSTGGEEEGYIYMSLKDLQRLTLEETLDVAELSVSVGSRKAAGTGIPGDSSGASSDDDQRIDYDACRCFGKTPGDRPQKSAGSLRRVDPEGISGRGNVPGRSGRSARNHPRLRVCPAGQCQCVWIVHYVSAASFAGDDSHIHGDRGCFLPDADPAGCSDRPGDCTEGRIMPDHGIRIKSPASPGTPHGDYGRENDRWHCLN